MLFRYLVVGLFLVTACFAEKLSSGEDVEKFVLEKISRNEVMVFAKSYCGYCKMTRRLLDSMKVETGIQVNVIDLDLLDQEDGAFIQMELMKQTGQRTVPNIFVGGEHIEGGNSGIQELARTGQLQNMIRSVVSVRH